MQNLIEYLKKQNKTWQFWLRCDDIGIFTKNFSAFDKLVKKYKIPTIYAVIPTQLESKTVKLIKKNKFVWVSQHGYEHCNHAGKQKCELVFDQELIENVLTEKENLKNIFPKQFVNILTPPYYNIDNKMSDVLKNHFDCISLFLDKSATFAKKLNPNVELVDWSVKNVFAGDNYVNNQIKKCSKKYDHISLCVHCEALDQAGFDYLEQFFKLVNKNKFFNKGLKI